MKREVELAKRLLESKGYKISKMTESADKFKSGDKVKVLLPYTLDKRMDGIIDHRASTQEIRDAGWDNGACDNEEFYVVKVVWRGNDDFITSPVEGISLAESKKMNESVGFDELKYNLFSSTPNYNRFFNEIARLIRDISYEDLTSGITVYKNDFNVDIPKEYISRLANDLKGNGYVTKLSNTGLGVKVSARADESAPVFADSRTSIDIRGLARVDQEELLNDYAGAIEYKDGVIYADETTIRQIRNDWDLWD